MLYIVDCSSLIELPAIAVDVAPVLDVMTDMVHNHELTFCDDVLPELKRRAAGEPTYIWAKAVGENRCDFGGDWMHHQFVVQRFPDIVDEDDPLSSAPGVVAQAYALNTRGITVITSEWNDKITRAGLRSACDHFSLPVLATSDFISDLGF